MSLSFLFHVGQILVGFMLSVIAGAQRFAHTNQLRADRALQALLGMKRFPSDDTILNYFRRFTQVEIERFWRPLWRWLIGRLPQLEEGFSLDLDSTIFSPHGTRQQGATKGYNPRRPGRLSHHPLLAVWRKLTLSYTLGYAAATPVPVKGRRSS